MRNRYIVAYDITDSQRLMRTYKKMLGYGDRVQYSVFICNLNKTELILMKEDLRQIINTKTDRVIIVDIGSSSISYDKKVIHMGAQISDTTPNSIVI